MCSFVNQLLLRTLGNDGPEPSRKLELSNVPVGHERDWKFERWKENSRAALIRAQVTVGVPIGGTRQVQYLDSQRNRRTSSRAKN